MKLPANIQRVLDSVFGAGAQTDPGLLIAASNRAAVAGGGERDDTHVPAAIQPYVDKVSLTPYTVVDGDIDALRKQGLSEDEIFELTVATALGAASGRFEKTLALLDEDRA